MNLLITLLSLAAAVTAFTAAHYWYQSAKVKAPDFGIVGAYSVSSTQLEPFNKWMQETALLSRKAARFAAVSALFTGSATLVMLFFT